MIHRMSLFLIVFAFHSFMAGMDMVGVERPTPMASWSNDPSGVEGLTVHKRALKRQLVEAVIELKCLERQYIVIKKAFMNLQASCEEACLGNGGGLAAILALQRREDNKRWHYDQMRNDELTYMDLISKKKEEIVQLACNKVETADELAIARALNPQSNKRFKR